jgi:Rrf2 family protein
MKISKLEEQSIRLAVALARQGEQMTLSELSAEERLSEALIAKIMGRLRQGGIIRAARGRSGGYELVAPPDELTVAAVIRALGRPLFNGCYTKASEPCPHESDCTLKPIWEYLQSAVAHTLDQITLSDLVKKERYVRDRMAFLHTGSAPVS